ncbi:hypothetical protein HK102_005377, partial [Quaeritorhiza haematococci]
MPPYRGRSLQDFDSPHPHNHHPHHNHRHAPHHRHTFHVRQVSPEDIVAGSSTSGTGSSSTSPYIRRRRSPHLAAKRRRTGSLLRRSSSFGGAPIVVKLKEPPPEVHKHRASSALRWLILFLSCLLLFGNYYAYDNPAALNKPLQEWLGHDYDQYQYELNLMYSVYSLPNMFLPFFGGQLVDRMDPKKVLLIFSGFVCLGQTLFAMGVQMKDFPTMLFGRILFGIGGESISVVQASITTSWFKNKELAFALGLNLCIARFGSVINAILSPRIEHALNVPAAVWMGGVTCYLSFVSAMILCIIMATHSPPDDSVVDVGGDLQGISTDASQGRSHRQQHRKENSNTREPDVTTPLLGKGVTCDDPEEMDVPEPLSPVSHAGSVASLSSASTATAAGGFVPFNNIASDFLMSKWFPGDTEKAGIVMSIPDTMSAILVPFCGVLVDRFGRRASLLIMCALVIAGVHTALGLTMINPAIPLVFLGLSYSIYGVAIWPSIATIIQHHEARILQNQKNHDTHHVSPPTSPVSPNGTAISTPPAPHPPAPKLLGTAYGISTAALNTALTIMPLMAAQVRVIGGSFVPVEMFFVVLALLGAGASTLLWITDARYGEGILEQPEIKSPATTHLTLPSDSSGDLPAIASSGSITPPYVELWNSGSIEADAAAAAALFAASGASVGGA